MEWARTVVVTSPRASAVLLAPYERLIDSGEPPLRRYAALATASRNARLKITAAAEGL